MTRWGGVERATAGYSVAGMLATKDHLSIERRSRRSVDRSGAGCWVAFDHPRTIFLGTLKRHKLFNPWKGVQGSNL
jgi:hypothetical protein